MGQGGSTTRDQVRGTGDIVADNREKLLERGEKLASIENRAENIAHGAKSFAANAKALREREGGGKTIVKVAPNEEKVKEKVVHSEEYLKREELIQRGMMRQKQRREEEKLAKEKLDKLDLNENSGKHKKAYKLAGWVGHWGKAGRKKNVEDDRAGEKAGKGIYGSWAEPLSEKTKSSSFSGKQNDRVCDVTYNRARTMEPGLEAIIVDTEEKTDLMKESELKYQETELEEFTKRAEVLEEATMQFLPVRQHSEKVNLAEKNDLDPSNVWGKKKKLILGLLVCLLIVLIIIIIIAAVLAADTEEDEESGSGDGEIIDIISEEGGRK